VALLNLEDRVAQVQLAQGTLNVRVRRLGPQEVFEIATPNLAYSIRRPGQYRIDVDPAGDTTAVVVRSGQAEVYGDGAAYVVNAREAYRFAGTDLSDYEYFEAPRADEFDRWSSDRDRRGATTTEAGASPRATATCGYRLELRPAGRLTTTDIGRGSTRGAGPGWMTRRGASRYLTTAAGRI